VRAIALLEEMAGLRERPGVSVNVGVQTNIAGPQLVGYAYEPCNRQTIDAEPATPTPTIEAELVTERPLPDTVIAYRRYEAKAAAERETARAAQHDRMNPVFRPRGY
jgi:hypothetical protein